MKKRLVSLLVMTVMVVFGAALVEAAESGSIGVTVTIIQGLDMDVGPGEWSVGSTSTDAKHTTWVEGVAGLYTVTNNGNGTSNMDIMGTITGGCSIGPSAAPDTYRIGHGQATESGTIAPSSYTEITNSDTNLATLPSGGEYRFDLELQTPTSTTYGGVQQTITVTITAKASLE